MLTMLWREDWSSGEVCCFYLVRQLRYLTRGATKRGRVKSQLTVRSEQFQCSMMGRSRIYGDPMARQVMGWSRREMDVGARKTSVGEVAPCGAPNDQGHRC